MTPRLCVTVTAATTAELRRRRDAAGDADLVELRLDSVADPDVAGALAGRRRPVIVTCRPSWEGGSFKGDEATRRGLLAQALELGAEFVDIEWKAGFTDLLQITSGKRIVLSSHEFSCVPTDLAERAAAMRATGAEVIKIAIAANRLSDCLPLKALAEGPRAGSGAQVLIAMGEAGIATRVLAGRFGSAWSVRGRFAGSGAGVAGGVAGDVPVSRADARYRSLRGRRLTGLAFGIARNA